MRNCIICGNNKKIEIFDSSVVVPSPYPLKGEQKIVKCDNCGFIFADSENTQDNYQEYYEVLNKHKKRAGDAISLDRLYYEKIFNYLNLQNKDLSILDFGSGDLLMKDILIENGYKNVAIFDVDLKINPEDKFDLIISTHTFEHILDGDIVLKKLINQLNINGQMLLAVPDVEGYLEYYRDPYSWFDLEHINHFSAASLINFVKASGLSVIELFRDKREVRPGLFYPEIIVKCAKNKLENKNLEENLDKETTSCFQEYIIKSKYDLEQAFLFFKKNYSKKIIIWGLGINVMRMLYHLKTIDADFVDSNPKLQGKSILGKKILSPEEIVKVDLDETIFIVFAVNFNDIIKAIQNQFGKMAKIINLSEVYAR